MKRARHLLLVAELPEEAEARQAAGCRLPWLWEGSALLEEGAAHGLQSPSQNLLPSSSSFLS